MDSDEARAQSRLFDEGAGALRVASDPVVRRSVRFIGAIADYRSRLVAILELEFSGNLRAVFASMRGPIRGHHILMKDTFTTTLWNLQTTFGSIYSVMEEIFDVAASLKAPVGKATPNSVPSGAYPSAAWS